MQCPNCRKVEKGQWLYANGCRTYPEFSVEDWVHEEDIYDIGAYSELVRNSYVVSQTISNSIVASALLFTSLPHVLSFNY